MRSERFTLGELSPDAQAIVELARDAAAPMSPEQQQSGLGRLRFRRELRLANGAGRGWFLRKEAAFALVGALVILFVLVRRPSALSYSVVGASQVDQGFVRSTATAPATLRFSDGSVAMLKGEARLRVAALELTGPKLALEEGVVHLDVVHRDGVAWEIQAGPFQVLVKGTAFKLAWVGTTGRMKLELERGSVWVSGPLSEAPIVLRAGQTLTMTLPEKQVLVEETRRDDAPPVASNAPAASATAPAIPTAEVGQAPALPETSAVESKSGQAVSAGKSSWSAELASGQFAKILESAESRGLDAALAERGSEDLAALADAARYLGRSGLARRALLSLRARFPGTTRAQDSAFLLGRLDESSAPRSAIGWYDRYLAEAPAGVYGSEALGRKMAALKVLAGVAQAKPIAELYLRRYPAGAYSSLARAIDQRP